MNRSSSPYRAPSPYGQPPYNPAVAQVGPGSVTYTSSTGPDGSIIYHSYKAVAASYQTPSGVVNGIQWIPAGSTAAPPAGAQPMPPEYAAAWGKPATSSPDWGRPDDKRRKHEDKDSKRHRNDDYELQKAREKDAQAMNRERRKSFSASSAGPPAPGGVQFPQAPQVGPYPVHPSVVAGGYAGSGYGNPSAHGRAPSGAYGDLSRQFGDMGLDRNREPEQRERKLSTRDRPTDATGRPRGDTGGTSHGGRTSPYGAPGTGAYTPTSGPYPKPYPTFGASPNVRPMDIPGGTTDSSGYPGSSYSSSPGNRATPPSGPQVYPKGHVLEGHPMPPGQVPSHPGNRSRAPSPNPMGYPSSNIGKSPRAAPSAFPNEPVQQLPAPEAFSRPINASNTFLPFETMKIDNLEDICDPRLPKMPSVLLTHDIFAEDWRRCMQDLGRSWTGKLPVAPLDGGGHPPRPSTLAADLIDLWNVSFFNARGVDLVLYKGRVRKTGTNPGQIDKRLPHYESPSETESSTEESDLSDYGKYVGGYGRNPNALPEAIEARRRRAEARKEKRRRRKERRERRRAKRYTVYLTFLPRSGAAPPPGPYGPPRGYPAHAYPAPPVPGGYPQSVPVGYGGY